MATESLGTCLNMWISVCHTKYKHPSRICMRSWARDKGTRRTTFFLLFFLSLFLLLFFSLIRFDLFPLFYPHFSGSILLVEIIFCCCCCCCREHHHMEYLMMTTLPKTSNWMVYVFKALNDKKKLFSSFYPFETMFSFIDYRKKRKRRKSTSSR